MRTWDTTRLFFKICCCSIGSEKFFTKIEFSSFFRFSIKPNEDIVKSSFGDAVFGNHYLSRFVSRNAFITSEEVIIHHRLISYLNLMPFLRHPKIIRVSDEVRDVI